MAIVTSSFDDEVKSGGRFEFGKNWNRFLATISEERIKESEKALSDFLRLPQLTNQSFLDIGCGSGLSSLSAFRLGAQVTSFDFDPDSVAATNALREEFASRSTGWRTMTGSAIDEDFMRSLGRFDIVYSWGVLHHTGDMLKGLDLAADCVKDGGCLFIAIYNDQGRASLVWRAIKRAYCSSPKALKLILILICLIRLWGPTVVKDTCRFHPLKSWQEYRRARGMSAWHDVVDWVGGYPFEVATPEKIFEFYQSKGFVLQALKTCAGGIGCNEYVFVRKT